MIRINLIAPERAQKAKPKGPRPTPGAVQSYLLLALFAGGALVVCGGLWWFKSAQLKELDTRIAADEKRQRDLQAIKLQVDQFQQKKAILENKVNVIEKLRAAQKVPGPPAGRGVEVAPGLRVAHHDGRERGEPALRRPEQQPGGGRRLHQRPPAQRLVPPGGSRLQPGAEQPRELQRERRSSRTLSRRPGSRRRPRRAPPARPAVARLRGPGRQEGERRWRRIPSPGSPWPASWGSRP